MKGRSGIPLRRALLRSQLLIIAVLSGALLVATYLGTASAVRSVIRSSMLDAVARVENELQLLFGPVRRALEIACAWHESGLLDAADPEALRRSMLPVIGDLSQVGGLELADGLTWLRLERTADGDWEVWTHDPDGDLGAAAAPGPAATWLDEATAQEPPPVAGSSDERLRWSEPYASPKDGRLVMSGSLACRPPSRAIVSADLVIEDLAAFSRRIEASPNGGVSLMTGDLRLVAYPEREPFWQGPDSRGWLLRTPAELQQPLIDDAIRAYSRVPAEDRGLPVRFTSAGASWWVQLREFPLGGGSSLVAAVMVPTSDLLAERRRFRIAIAGVTLAVLLAAVVWAMRFARRLSRPIESLVLAGERISRGELDAAIETKSRLADVRALAEAQEKMRSGLRVGVERQRDLLLARQIQQEALPKELPWIEGYDLAAWSEPAAETGGDTYDVIPMPPGTGDRSRPAERAILLVADASGHGVAPALVVTQLRAMLRIAARLGAELPRLVAEMNELLATDLPRNRFITAWLAELDAREHVLRWLGAGHGPLLWYCAADGEVLALAPNEFPIGMFPYLRARPFAERVIAPGDVVVSLTDGFFEAENPDGQELGVEAMRQVLRTAHATAASSIIDALRGAALAWSAGRPLGDDCSVLVVKRLRR